MAASVGNSLEPFTAEHIVCRRRQFIVKRSAYRGGSWLESQLFRGHSSLSFENMPNAIPKIAECGIFLKNPSA